MVFDYEIWQQVPVVKFITDYTPQACIILHNSCLSGQRHNDVETC